MQKRLYKSEDDVMIAGVCGGIAEYCNIDPTIIRILWVVISLSCGVGLILYIIMAIVVPKKSKIERLK
ncbi:MAG: PspC domain-containing protein [Peptostreptococcus sp.]|uniref:PspC domain-containing protein n=1 Tax=Peptostreptococcus sp. TaxID=1262 RepID=UPI002FC78C7D